MNQEIKGLPHFKIEERVINRKNEVELLNQFYVTVEATFERLNNNYNENSEEKSVARDIEALLKKPNSWLNVYKIEHLLVYLYDDMYITFEIKRRLLEIDRNLYREQIKFYNTEAANLSTLAEKRIFLSRLINDLQWRYTIRETKLEFQRKARKISSTVLFVSIILFMAVLFIRLFGQGNANIAYLDISKLTDFYIMIEVATAGLFGASLSIATSINKSINSVSFDNLKLTHRLNYILSRVSIGMGAAIIMYYFIRSGILTDSTHTTTIELEYKLIILGFVAGFSEKLIPSVLTKTGENIASEKPSTEETKN